MIPQMFKSLPLKMIILEINVPLQFFKKRISVINIETPLFADPSCFHTKQDLQLISGQVKVDPEEACLA